MRRLIIGLLVLCALAACWLTACCGYIVIENPHDSVQIGSPTYQLDSDE